MYEVRFHLGAGANFRRWQVRGPNRVEYHDPDTNSLVLEGCVLLNRKSVAERVFSSKKRDVCGRVLCDSVEVIDSVDLPEGRVVHFDPKVAPYWVVEGLEGSQDGIFIPALISHGRRLYELCDKMMASDK